MLISIVIPVYNSSKYLSECIESLIKQTYKKLEIICVNDGSKDNSLDILNGYMITDNRIKVFTKENEGKGAASARNFGLDHATGDYVIFLDSDDFFEEDMIDSLVRQAIRTDSDLIVFDANVYDESVGRVTSKYPGIHLNYAPKLDVFSYLDITDYIFQMADHIVWNKMFRRSLLKDNDLYFEAIPICDDQFVPVLALVLAKRISIVDRPFVNYRVNTGVGQWDSRMKHPEVAYEASYSIVRKLKKLGIYQNVKKSYINIVMGVMRLIMDEAIELSTFEDLYYKYREDVFSMLEATNLPKKFFFDPRLEEWFLLINNHSLKEILFLSARAYGADMTTGILRFQLPYNQIKKGSKIILVGKGIIGRYWYSQLVLSDYAEVVAWVDSEEAVPDNIECDSVLVAK